MTIDDQIEDEKLQYDINREAAKISVLLSDKTDKYENLTGEETLPSNQKQIIKQAKLFFFRKALLKNKQKQLKIKEKQENKEDIKPIEGVFSKDMRTNEIKNEIYEIKKWKENIKQEDLD